jgi:hypothetical protein
MYCKGGITGFVGYYYTWLNNYKVRTPLYIDSAAHVITLVAQGTKHYIRQRQVS